jgi:Lon-like ATP-dependent protease
MPNLVLNDEVIGAVREGQFSIWPIRLFEEGWEILAGMPAGERDDEGGFPSDSVYGRAAARLSRWARGWRDFGKPVREGRRAEPEETAVSEEAVDTPDDEEEEEGQAKRGVEA